MEKAMQHAHGIGYSEYCRNLDVRIQVEQAREEDHSKSNQVVQNLQRQVHS